MGTQLSIVWILECLLQPQNLNVKLMVQNLSVSNLLLTLYVISYTFNKKACFIAAFFMGEIFGNTFNFIDLEYGYRVFIGYAVIYCALYWVCVVNKESIKTLTACGIMILFQILMVKDAFLYYAYETFIDTYYVYFIVLTHLLIILSVHGKPDITKILKFFIRIVDAISHSRDPAAFVRYNIRKVQ